VISLILLLPYSTGHLIHHVRMGKTVKQCVNQFPSLSIVSNIQPVTRTVLRVRLTITAEFDWNDKVHGGTSEPWWIWVEDPDNDHIYHSEYFLLLKKHVSRFSKNRAFTSFHIFKSRFEISRHWIVFAGESQWATDISLHHSNLWTTPSSVSCPRYIGPMAWGRMCLRHILQAFNPTGETSPTHGPPGPTTTAGDRTKESRVWKTFQV
jgi:hypothetical protein